MGDTLNTLSAEFRANSGNRVRTNDDIHFMLRRLLDDIMARLHDAGTDLTKLGALHADLVANAVDIAAGISGVAAGPGNTPQPGNVRGQVPGADASGRVRYPDGARGPLDGNGLNIDGVARNADGTLHGGAPGGTYGGHRNADGSAHNPNEPARNPDGTPREPLAPRNPDGSLINP